MASGKQGQSETDVCRNEVERISQGKVNRNRVPNSISGSDSIPPKLLECQVPVDHTIFQSKRNWECRSDQFGQFEDIPLSLCTHPPGIEKIRCDVTLDEAENLLAGYFVEFISIAKWRQKKTGLREETSLRMYYGPFTVTLYMLAQVWPSPVAGKEVFAPDHDLPNLISANRSAVSVDKQDLHVWYGVAYRKHTVDQFALIVVYLMPIVERLCRPKADMELAVNRKVLTPHSPLSACYCLA